MKTIFVSPLKSDHYYHIFNQGNNQEDIYKEGKNYIYFLEKYKELIAPIAKTYAFCLLPNHFHIFLKIKSYTGLSNALPVKFPRPPKILNGNSLNKEKLNDFDNIISKKLSRRFAGFFAGYARAINNGYGRSGKLFSLPFKRIEVKGDEHFKRLICYIHRNPIHHLFCENYNDWPYTSFYEIVEDKSDFIETEAIIKLFGSTEAFKSAHQKSQIDFLERRLLLE